MTAADPTTDAASYPARSIDAVLVPRRPRPRSVDAGSAGVPPLPGVAERRLAARRLLVVVGGGVAMVVVGVVLLALLLTVR